MTNSEQMYETGRGVVAVIPTYCEVESLPGLLSRLHAVLPELSVLIVDDSSPDGTGEWVRERMESDSRLHLHTRPAKSGLATAYVEGLGRALEMGFDYLIQMDADASHRPEDLPKLLVRAAGPDHPDMVIGSRWVPGGKTNGWAPWRVALSRAGNAYINFWLGTRIKDATAGLRVHKASWLRETAILDKVSTVGFGFQVEMTTMAEAMGATIVEVPITFDERELGESKLSGSIFVEELVMVTKNGIKRKFSRRKK